MIPLFRIQNFPLTHFTKLTFPGTFSLASKVGELEKLPRNNMTPTISRVHCRMIPISDL